MEAFKTQFCDQLVGCLVGCDLLLVYIKSTVDLSQVVWKVRSRSLGIYDREFGIVSKLLMWEFKPRAVEVSGRLSRPIDCHNSQEGN